LGPVSFRKSKKKIGFSEVIVLPIYNRTIQVRLSGEEKNMIIRRMISDGSHNMSEWIRGKLIKEQD